MCWSIWTPAFQRSWSKSHCTASWRSSGAKKVDRSGSVDQTKEAAEAAAVSVYGVEGLSKAMPTGW